MGCTFFQNSFGRLFSNLRKICTDHYDSILENLFDGSIIIRDQTNLLT
ncbi:hypothetical protein FHS90_000966 [Rufibacter quisquiliarum]|uniref:Uncharacterized protein n=1 Tax=Rufibacter quisquiliarum TaxID=1549639 RepID=A0A839GBE9_9BACT|nr:hypothetical protein [Rufibacter quisquiliarum]